MNKLSMEVKILNLGLFCWLKTHIKGEHTLVIHDYDSLTIFGWMINKLKLKGTELLVFAKFFNDGQDGGPIPVDIEYLKKFIGQDESSILGAIKVLELKGLITYLRVYRDLSNCFILNFEMIKAGGVE